MTIRSPRGIIQLPEEDVRDVQGNAASKLKLSELRDLVRRIKGIDDPQPSDMYALWEAAIGQMELAEDMGMEPHDPWYWLQQQAEAADADAERRRQAEQAVSETIQRTISLTDPDTAGVVIRSVMRRLLRRDPKDAEVAEFLDALNAKERGAPQVTTTTSTPAPLDEDGLPTGPAETETVQEGGAPNAGDFAELFVDDNFKDEQAVIRTGEYFNALQAAVGSIA
jgi:hypothetical protein